MRFGITILPEHRWADAEPLWRRSEELGFDHAWTYDHLDVGRPARLPVVRHGVHADGRGDGHRAASASARS